MTACAHEGSIEYAKLCYLYILKGKPANDGLWHRLYLEILSFPWFSLLPADRGQSLGAETYSLCPHGKPRAPVSPCLRCPFPASQKHHPHLISELSSSVLLMRAAMLGSKAAIQMMRLTARNQLSSETRGNDYGLTYCMTEVTRRVLDISSPRKCLSRSLLTFLDRLLQLRLPTLLPRLM